MLQKHTGNTEQVRHTSDDKAASKQQEEQNKNQHLSSTAFLCRLTFDDTNCHKLGQAALAKLSESCGNTLEVDYVGLSRNVSDGLVCN